MLQNDKLIDEVSAAARVAVRALLAPRTPDTDQVPRGFGITDMHLPDAEVRSLEIFSDGYYGLPEGTHVTDWERRFAEIEIEDPHKIHAYPEVKGSSGAEFSDDRTVLCLHRTG